jgi:CRISPR system Cascade subunit CasE
MPYLSRIWLNPLRTGAQRLLHNPQATHAAVLGGLSRQPVDERVLWRLDLDNPHRAGLLVLTHSTPSWEHLIEQAGWSAADEPQALVRSYEPLLAHTDKGREFRFRLRANPVTSTHTPHKPSPAQRHRLEHSQRPRGVRVPHRTAAHQLQWFLSRASTWGFDIPHTHDGHPDVQLVARDRTTFTKTGRNGHNNANVVLQTATFEGRLRIENPDLARDRLLSGLGPARAYGCGLLTLAPPHASEDD